ncbi:DUF87 domain-containing protein [Halobacteria archaeon AArc-m2/3/4]|uniref:DUF87 domain-containing protein n=1 Tax=Natronoglomus mannanivorans TaxID=2979990 RepID=A0AAP2Z0N3_9EURY|nr:DUF87 domain-containing protein [Halobacteria archaeon AArc-xg1-1]MCU4974219.1 DUF87 domain-containing protein [Halobacteria archaeon AArc-m2/3/4]
MSVSEQREIVVGETGDGEDVRLPVVQLLTGRGFVTGKSGSGKSNTASVVAEELLEAGYPLLVVDTDGEYYGLKEEYEMLHAGADEECDIQIGPEHAEQMASLALEENVPVILDVSGYLDEEVADELLRETARQLFVKEKKLKKPFLLVVEEVHEYIPEGGGVGETGKMLIKIGKRGRKHGLGILGISQRPADVKKDFITQANWLVWHRLTWENDTKVVGRIIDTEYSELVSGLNDGQAFIQTDWTESDVRKIQFRRKRTFDAGATPGLDDFERPELKSVSDALVGDLQNISERKQQEENRIEELERKLTDRDDRIEDLEEELESARDVSSAARQMADALSQPNSMQTELPGSSEEFRRLHEEVVELEAERDDLREELESREGELEDLESENDRLRDRVQGLEHRLGRVLEKRAVGSKDDEGSGAENENENESEAPILDGQDDHEFLEFGYTSVEGSDGELLDGSDAAAGRKRRERADAEDDGLLVANGAHDLEELLGLPAVDERLTRACGNSRCDEDTARQVVADLIREGPCRTEAIAGRVGRTTIAVQSLLSELRTEAIVDRNDDGSYAVADDVLAGLSRPVESE